MVNQMQHDFVGSPVAQDYGEILGTPFAVFLSGGVEEKLDKATGRIATEIVDLPGLIASILQSRVLHPRKLSGEDLKYIRSALQMRSGEVAEVLDVSPEHYSRCEAGTKTLSSSSEKFFRMYVFLQAAWKATEVQEKLSKKKKEGVSCENPEKAKEALEAFQSVFVEMKIQHIFSAGDDLAFSFSRELCRDDERSVDCGKEDGKWRKEPQQQAA